MKRLSMFVLFLVIFLSGCVTTGGQTAGQQLDSLTDNIATKFASLTSSVGTDPVTLNFSGVRGFLTDNNDIQEVFATLPSLNPAVQPDAEAAQSVVTLGALLNESPSLMGYIYVNPSDSNSSIAKGYVATIEQVAGRGRITLKYDARLSMTHIPLAWLTNPSISMGQQDALLSAAAHGLTVPKTPVAMR